MKKIISKIKTNLPTGLTAKLIRFVVIFLLVLGVVLFAISSLQVHGLEHLVRDEGEDLTNQIRTESRESMNELIEDRLHRLSVAAADKTDDEIWVNEYELRILGEQVADVIRHPENYGRVPVGPPDKNKGGELSLQLMAADGYENISPETMEQMERLANLEPIMAAYIGQYTIDCYIALPDGTTMIMDRYSDQKYDENGNIKPYDATSRPWFQGAVKNQDIYFTPAVKSHFYDFDIVAYGLPVYVDGELVAVLEGSLSLDALRERVEYLKYSDKGFNILISNEGQLVSTSRTSGELAMRADLAEDIRESVNPSLVELINAGLSGGSGTMIVEVDGEDYYAGYGPLVTIGWTQLGFVSVEELMKPTKALINGTVSSFVRTEDRIRAAFHRNIAIMLLLMGGIVILSIILVSRLAQKRVAPIRHMTERIREMSGKNITFEMEEIYKTGDEIETLASSFEEQSNKLGDYIAENIRISSEKQRIDTELNVATNIQTDMLPNIFPIFPDRKEFELYASMNAAKEVGGDFYDMFLIDDDHLCMVVGDVSGKGVPAALFMVISKTMLKNRAQADGKPAEILYDVNNSLHEGNREMMFVTVWLGILTISTGHLVWANAGHECAAICPADGDYALYEDRHGFVLGCMEDRTYVDNEVVLKNGDALFLYTDGLPDATNANMERMGPERMLAALNAHKEDTAEQLLENIKEEVDRFVGDAPQFDDLTMLIVKYHG